MDYGLTNTVALVTGASRGIGLAVARALCREGAAVALCARDAGALEREAEALRSTGARAVALPSDLAQPGVAADLVRRTRDALGGAPLLVVVCHAGMTPMAKVHSLPEQAVREALDLEISATLALLGAALPEMMAARFGRVVLVGSASAALGQGGAPLYCAVKSALEGLARNLAVDFGRHGITANVVAPGFVDTERLQARTDEPKRQRLRAATSMRRLAQPEEIAAVVAFICSRAAGYLTGAVIPVTGGAHLANLW